MNVIEKSSLVLKSGGLKAIFRSVYSYLETRLTIISYRLLPTCTFQEAHDAACIKILKKQEGDFESSEMLDYLIHELNQLQPDKRLKIVVPNYFHNAFTIASPIIARGRVDFYALDAMIDEADLFLFNRSMLNQVPGTFAKLIEGLKVIFVNNSYVVLSKLKIPECGKYVELSANDIADIISQNSDSKTKKYIVENGYNFVVRDGSMDHGIINEVKHEYLDRLMQDDFTGKNVIDLGGHIGSFSIQVTKFLCPESRVICIEPLPSNVDMIRENIDLNKLGDIINVRQIAVSSKPGKATLYISFDNTGGNKLDMVESSSKEAIEVEVTTLSNIIDGFGGETIDLLKIDVEGSECPILFPHGELLKRKVKRLVGEAGRSPYGGGLDVIKFLQSHDFDVEYTGNASQLIFFAKNLNFN